jgi:hypothetical protein
LKTNHLMWLGQIKKAAFLPSVRYADKKRSDPLPWFWYASIGGHFCSFLVSNIFLSSLSIIYPLHFSIHAQNAMSQFSTENTVCFSVHLLRQGVRLVLCCTRRLVLSIPTILPRFFVSDRPLYQIHTMAFQPHTGIHRKNEPLSFKVGSLKRTWDCSSFT